jgi:FAD/FMN-containing dehydrogenase
MTPSQQTLAQLFTSHSLPVITDAHQITKLSQDYFHFSPLLQAQLQNKRADVVVQARHEEEVLAIAALCVENRLPLTVRGAGTGNYGQCIPLQGGVVLDLSPMNRIIQLEPGWAIVETGVRMAALQRSLAAEKIDWELRIAPSTYQTATVGGFLAGGSVGMGSINYGLITEAGNVRAVRIVTLEDSPQILTLRGAECQALLHSYGTNGIITQVDLPLAPRYPWAELIVCFQDFVTACYFAQSLAQRGGIVKKQLAVHADPIPQYFTALKGLIPPGCHGVLAIIADFDQQALRDLIKEYQGNLTHYQLQSSAQAHNLVEFNWNHTTLLARAAEPDLTYLQVFYRNLEQAIELRELFATELMVHLEFFRVNGQLVAAGLPLVRYQNPTRLAEIISIYQQRGAAIANPHVYTLEEGGTGPLSPAQIALKQRVDPYGLLNPGKMASYSSSPPMAMPVL